MEKREKRGNGVRREKRTHNILSLGLHESCFPRQAPFRPASVLFSRLTPFPRFASCGNAIEALGGVPPSEARLRELFDAVRPHNWDSGGAGFDEAAIVMNGLGYRAEAIKTSLNGLLKLDNPAVLGIRWNTGCGHVVLMESSSYKQFLFFKYNRQYTIVDPWNERSPLAAGIPARNVLSHSQLKNYQNEGYYSKDALVFRN